MKETPKIQVKMVKQRNNNLILPSINSEQWYFYLLLSVIVGVLKFLIETTGIPTKYQFTNRNPLQVPLESGRCGPGVSRRQGLPDDGVPRLQDDGAADNQVGQGQPFRHPQPHHTEPHAEPVARLLNGRPRYPHTKEQLVCRHDDRFHSVSSVQRHCGAGRWVFSLFIYLLVVFLI